MKAEIEWIPVHTRKPTGEELEVLSEKYLDEYFSFVYDCALPNDGEDVLITTRHHDIKATKFYTESCGGYFEYFEDEGEVIAWAKLPSPYKKGE